MTAPVVLLADERMNRSERLSVRWVQSDSGSHRLELAIDQLVDGEWRRGYHISVGPGEVFRLHDAIGQATYLAARVPR